MKMSAKVKILVTDTAGIARQNFPVTRGIPFPQGRLSDIKGCSVTDRNEESIQAQFRVLGRWPDGTIKWLLTDFQATVEAGGSSTYTLDTDGQPKSFTNTKALGITETRRGITVDTGPLRFTVSKKRFSLIENAVFSGKKVIGPGDGDSHVRISESRIASDGRRFLYGLGGGTCKASLAEDGYKATLEEVGPLRAVIRCDGAYEADYPMGNYGGYRPFQFTVRIYAYAGKPYVRVLHTITMTANPRETEVEEMMVHVPVRLGNGQRWYRLSGDTEGHDVEDIVRSGESLLLSQRAADHYTVSHRRGEHSRRIAEGERAQGYGLLEDGKVGIAVAQRYMPEEYPKAIGINGDGEGIDLYLWRDPDGQRLSFARYDESVHWELGESAYSDGLGVAKTHEYFIAFYNPENDSPRQTMKSLLEPAHAATEPGWNESTSVLGGFARREAGVFPRTEELLDRYVEWVTWNTKNGGWYGCYDFGDYMITFDDETGRWKQVGRWSWNNSEFDARHGLWIQYARTGDPEIFRLAESSSRHSMDVDTCHYNPFRPYTVGGCFRHAVSHWGDEPCPSHTFIDGWMDHYYLTGDARTLDVIHEAGQYFMNFRWTDDPALSFSLRGIANNFRGVCHLYELTGSPEYLNKATELFEVLERGQRSDGSWIKRFQLNTPDRMARQHPFGMASEGSALAVEMDHVPQFTEQELVTLFGEQHRFHKIISQEALELPGYQMHYLLPAIEQFYALTGEKRALEMFVRCVDWFCDWGAGHDKNAPSPSSYLKSPLQGWHTSDDKRYVSERYHGMLGRSLAAAYDYTGDLKYLNAGAEMLAWMLDNDLPNQDERVKGTVFSGAMTVCLIFWGVPRLIMRLKDAGIEEPTADSSA